MGGANRRSVDELRRECFRQVDRSMCKKEMNVGRVALLRFFSATLTPLWIFGSIGLAPAHTLGELVRRERTVAMARENRRRAPETEKEGRTEKKKTRVVAGEKEATNRIGRNTE